MMTPPALSDDLLLRLFRESVTAELKKILMVQAEAVVDSAVSEAIKSLEVHIRSAFDPAGDRSLRVLVELAEKRQS